MRQFFCALILLFFALPLAQAQNGGTVRGNVFDKDSGEPIIYGTVRLVGTDFGVSTDFEGFFSMGNVPPGEYTLAVSYVGYDSTAVDINVKNGSNIYKRIMLQEGGINLGEIQISAEREKSKNQVKASVVTITPRQIRALPSVGGEADIAQYLSILPGIISTGDQGGQIYIRGGSPVQNKILLDGLTIYNAFHSIGLFSVFETEAVRNIDVYTGGFNAEYGSRISAIVDINTREGNKKRWGGKVGINPFLSKVLIEGPLKKLKDEGGGSTSLMVTGKYSYIDQTSKSLYSYVDSAGLPYNFQDIYAKLSMVSQNGSKLDLFGFNFDDNAKFAGVADLNWITTGGGARFKLIPRTSAFIIGGLFGFSSYEIGLNESDGRPRKSSIEDFSGQIDFTYFGRANELKYGVNISSISTNFEFNNLFGQRIEQEDFNTELSAFAKYRHKFGNLIIEPGFRVQFYASANQVSPEPRLGIKYNASDRLRIKVAGGMYSQNLISSVNERDIVNLFVGFLAGPDERVIDPVTGEETDDRLQKSIQGVFGIEYDINNNLEINIEPYYKDFTQLININRNKLEATDPNYLKETGEAYGIDLLAKFNTRNVYLWAAYSYGFVNRDDGVQEYPTIFDRRHNANFLATYNTLGENPWEFSLRWNYGSGFPFTLTEGFYTYFSFEDGVDTDILSGNPDLGIIYDEVRNGGRLPQYHRLDLSVKKEYNFTDHLKVEIVGSVTNGYDRENIFFFDRVKYDRVDQLPILPSMGVNVSF
ncbi:MAG: TonB-dependent receptor plug domain-containing protein [Saprospiraceae bacterium]|nr:TonB-dependent receptor plug domain-containing protein [Saprospiraceae bacterium]